MLVLSRKMQQEIVIGDNVTITVLSVKGNTVRLGIDAPREIRVLRGELPANSDLPGDRRTSEQAASPSPDSPTLAKSLANKSIGDVTIVYSDQLDGQTSVEQRLKIVPFSNAKPAAPDRSNRHDASGMGHNSNRLKDIVDELSR